MHGNVFEHILTGSEKIEQIQGNILLHIDFAATSLITLTYNVHMGKELSPEQKIKFIETANKLYEAIIPDGNYLFYNCRLASNHHILAKLWCEAGDKYKTVECLEAAARCAESYDNLLESTEYTSLFINRSKHLKASTSKNWVGTECGMLYERMTQPVFDSI